MSRNSKISKALWDLTQAEAAAYEILERIQTVQQDLRDRLTEIPYNTGPQKEGENN